MNELSGPSSVVPSPNAVTSSRQAAMVEPGAMDLFPLDNVIQPYAWGSRSSLAELMGAPSPSPTPEAELWMGAHPLGPSRLAGQSSSLLELVERNPEGVLGAEVAARFSRLPFLFKVIAAAEPLSLQAHPSLEQARHGYALEEAAGVPRDARHRNYKDDNHKPELVCALTPFVALCGFRAAKLCVSLVEVFAIEGIEEAFALLERSPDEQGMRLFFEALYTLEAPALERAVVSVVRGCARIREELARDPSATFPLAPAERELVLTWLPRVAALHPRDAGVIGALLLNIVELAPGEAIYLPAGNLHAYLNGTALEIMASSDNVLRGGLTPKHVDVPELLRIVSFRAHDPGVMRPQAIVEPQGQELVYAAPVAEFGLSVVELGGSADGGAEWLGAAGPEILLCLEGKVRVSRGQATRELSRGQSVFCAAAGVPYTLTGAGRVARARTGRSL